MEEEGLEEVDVEGRSPVEVVWDAVALEKEETVNVAAAEMGVIVAEVEAAAGNGAQMKAMRKAVGLCVAQIGVSSIEEVQLTTESMEVSVKGSIARTCGMNWAEVEAGYVEIVVDAGSRMRSREVRA